MLIAFSGLKGSGKDTAASVLIEEYGFTKIAFADAVRDLALIIDPLVSFKRPYDEGHDVIRLSQLVTQFGWDKIKREIPEVRRLLQVIGTEAGRQFFNQDIWIEILDKDYPDLSWDNTRYVITDCRFDNEIDFVRDKGGYVVWVERPGVVSDGHASESPHIKNLATAIVHNDSTLDELRKDIHLLMFMRGVDPFESSRIDQTATD